MKKVYKYLLPSQDEVRLEMPMGARILHVGVQDNEQLCLWALVSPAAKKITRKFRIAGTGHEITGPSSTHLGTAVMYNGQLVLHVFEMPT